MFLGGGKWALLNHEQLDGQVCIFDQGSSWVAGVGGFQKETCYSEGVLLEIEDTTRAPS